MPRVLVACEFSGIVRDAFLDEGIPAVSCDLLPSESSRGSHYQGDVQDLLGDSWDLMIAHPPCTYLSYAGARWFSSRPGYLRAQALEFVQTLLDCAVPRIALENPRSLISAYIRKPDQIIQPWQFGHGETKATCLWLKNLPPLIPTQIVPGREQRILKISGPDRAKKRSITYPGIARAMAQQWGNLLKDCND